MELDVQEQYADSVENHKCFFQEGVTSKKATTTDNGMGDQWYGNTSMHMYLSRSPLSYDVRRLKLAQKTEQQKPPDWTDLRKGRMMALLWG